jgi:hypothetical protein
MFANNRISFGRGSSAACCVAQERYYLTTSCDKFAPILTRWLGNVFERRLVETYISENGTDPVTGEDLTVEDLIDLKQARVVRPRPPTLTSIPALLSTFQNEWDAIILETYQLKQQLAETRQELSTALYYSDSAEKVIARLQTERDEARDALAKISVTSTSNGANGDAMQVDGQGLPEAIVAKIEQTQTEYAVRERVAHFHLLICCYQIVVHSTKAPDTRGLGNPRVPAGHAIHPELGTFVSRRPLNRRQRDRRPGTGRRKRWRGWRLLSITRAGCPDIEVWRWFCYRCCLVWQQACGCPLDRSCQDLRQWS